MGRPWTGLALRSLGFRVYPDSSLSAGLRTRQDLQQNVNLSTGIWVHLGSVAAIATATRTATPRQQQSRQKAKNNHFRHTHQTSKHKPRLLCSSRAPQDQHCFHFRRHHHRLLIVMTISNITTPGCSGSSSGRRRMRRRSRSGSRRRSSGRTGWTRRRRMGSGDHVDSNEDNDD